MGILKMSIARLLAKFDAWGDHVVERLGQPLALNGVSDALKNALSTLTGRMSETARPPQAFDVSMTTVTTAASSETFEVSMTTVPTAASSQTFDVSMTTVTADARIQTFDVSMTTVTVDGNSEAQLASADSSAPSLWVPAGEPNVMEGTSGPEDIIGTSGPDIIHGHGDKDRLYGQGGDDVLYGGAGNDTLVGGPGRDNMYGGSGDDIYRVDDPGDVISEETVLGVDDGGTDYVQSSISYKLGNFVERLELRDAQDAAVSGNNLANTLKGNDFNNVISGHGGTDILYGFGGDDILVGGAGKDYFYGGEGSDIFVLGSPATADNDRIYDFAAEDFVGIYAADYGLTEGAGLTGGQLDPAYFTTGTAATSTGHGQFVYNTGNGLLYWDPDGIGGSGRITVATFTVGAAVTASRFTIMDETPSVSVSAFSMDPMAEDTSSVYFVIRLDGPAREDTLVTFSTADGTALAGSDYVGITSGQVIIAAGDVFAYVKVDLIDDHIAENPESFSLVVQSAELVQSGQPLDIQTAAASVTIVDEGPRVVSSLDTAALGIPDPAGLAYNPNTGTLFLSDSEVDEEPFQTPLDLYAFTIGGGLDVSYALGFTTEATGLAYDSTNGVLFISDDDEFLVYAVDPNNPTNVLWQFDTIPIGGDDPEDLAFDPTTGHLFIVNGESRTIVETDTMGSQVFRTITLPAEIADPEALVYDPHNDVFYVGGGFSANVWKVDRDGNIVDTIDILADFRHPDNNTRVNVKDLELAPASDGSGQTNLYVADFGWSHVNDGRIIEIDLGDRPQTVLALSTLNSSWDLI
jgi:hypothetical protein